MDIRWEVVIGMLGECRPRKFALFGTFPKWDHASMDGDSGGTTGTLPMLGSLSIGCPDPELNISPDRRPDWLIDSSKSSTSSEELRDN